MTLFSDGLDIQGNKRPERTESSGKTSERARTDQIDAGYGGVRLLFRRPLQQHLTHEGETVKAVRAVPGIQ